MRSTNLVCMLLLQKLSVLLLCSLLLLFESSSLYTSGDVCVHEHVCECMCTYVHVRMCVRVHCVRKCSSMRDLYPIQAYTHSHTYTHAHMHTHTCTHAYTHTRMHTHIHACAP